MSREEKNSEGPGFLRIESVTRVFDEVEAVRDFSLDISEGEFVSLLGPSGCGKTTLLRMIAGLEYPNRGRILLEDHDITYVPTHKRPINLVFQRVTLFPHLNVFENVAFGLRLRRLRASKIEQRVREALALVRLSEYEPREVHTLSGGEAQRVALARAIVNRPKVLLFDEPLSALDLQIRRELQLELKDIHRELHGTFVYVTHDQEEAMSMSDRVVVQREGEIIQVGTPVELYRSPASLFVASFVGNSNIWKGEVVDLDKKGTIVDVDGRILRGQGVSEVGPGDTVWVVLRIEALSLSSASESSLDRLTSLEGRVADVRFVGPVVHYRIDLGDRVLAVSRPSEAGRLIAEGEKVLVSWQSENALIFRDPE
jgi:ABC-type Fe3+/spermidine/putrescine transport system ATPase subunit